MNGEKETGITFHLMDENLDTGPILMQKKIDIVQGFNGDTGETLKNKCCNLAKSSVCELLTSLNDDMIIPINQSTKEATYYPQINEKDILIDFTKTAVQISALIRGLSPWQPAYIAHKNTFLKAGKTTFFENGISSSLSRSQETGTSGDSKFKFMLRPSVKGYIPIYDWSIVFGVGYDYIFDYEDLNGINFSIGFQYSLW